MLASWGCYVFTKAVMPLICCLVCSEWKKKCQMSLLMFLVLSNNPKCSSATLSQSKNSKNTLYFVLGSFFLTQRASSTSFTEIQDNTLTQDVCPFPSLYFSSMDRVFKLIFEEHLEGNVKKLQQNPDTLCCINLHNLK